MPGNPSTKTSAKNSPAALITGGATRLGLSFAKALAQEGYNIALHYHRSKESAQLAKQEIEALGVYCELFQADLSGDYSEQLIHNVVDRFPGLEVLINSASAYDAATIANTGKDLLQHQFAVNFFAPFMLTQAFTRLLLAKDVAIKGASIKGSVINILDNKVAFQQNDYAAYLLSKKTLAEFTRLSAVEYAPNFRINGIAPGVVLPGDERTEDYVKWRVDGIPLKQQGTVDDLVNTMNFLLNNEFITGQIITVDGGENINHQGRHAEMFNQKDCS